MLISSKLHSRFQIILVIILIEPPHGKTNNLHMRKQGADQLRGAFVFATRIVQSLYVNTKIHVSSCLLLLCSPVYVGSVRKPHCWFSHEAALISQTLTLIIFASEICIGPNNSLAGST